MSKLFLSETVAIYRGKTRRKFEACELADCSHCLLKTYASFAFTDIFSSTTRRLGGELIIVELISTSNQKEKKKTSKVLQCELVDLAMIRNNQPPSQRYSVHYRADIYALFM